MRTNHHHQDASSAVGLREVGDALKAIFRRNTAPILVVWGFAHLADLLIILRLTSPQPGHRDLFTPALQRALNSPRTALALVVTYVFLTAFRIGLYRPLRRVVVDGHAPGGVWPSTRSAMRAIFPVLATEQILAILQLAVMAVCLWINAIISFMPLILFAFAMAPALYFVSAEHRSISAALARSIDASRRHWTLVFGGQAIFLCLSVALFGGMVMSWRLISPAADAAPIDAAFIASQMLFGFAEWAVMAAVYLAIDAASQQR